MVMSSLLLVLHQGNMCIVVNRVLDFDFLFLCSKTLYMQVLK